MKKSLTRAGILRRRSDIAELFPKKSARKPTKQNNAKNGRNFSGFQKPAFLYTDKNTVEAAARLLDAQQICLALQPNKGAEQSASPAVLLRCSTSEAGLRLCVAARHNAQDKLFVSPARRLGGAVVRNRAKRLQREFYRHSRELLRTISRRAAESAIWKLCGALLSQTGISVNAKTLLAAWPGLEQKLGYHWGLIILNLAPNEEISEAEREQKMLSHSAVPAEILALEQFWPRCQKTGHDQSDFGRELHRYQRLLAKLEKALQQKWLDYLQYNLLFRGRPVLGKAPI